MTTRRLHRVRRFSLSHPARLVGVALAATVVFGSAAPAFAVVDTQTWTSPSHQWWTSGTWSTGEVPENGDSLIFPSTAAPRSDANVGPISLVSMSFTGDHQLGSAAPAGVITLTGAAGLVVDGDPGPIDVIINNDVDTTGTQTWFVGAGDSLSLPALVRVSPTGSLTLDIEGELTISGNIDGQVTGLIAKTGAGTIVRTGGLGGAVGGGGLDVQEGEFMLDDATIGGTEFQITGGRLTGDGVVYAITLTSGVIAPSDGTAGPIEFMVGANGVQLDGGTYIASIDGVSGDSDYLTGGNGVLGGSGTILELDVITVPTIGDNFAVAGVQFGTVDMNMRFRSPAGVVLEEGDEFVSDGGLWSISYAGVISVTYLGVAPAAPSAPELADTGAGEFGTLGALAVFVTMLGATLVMRRRTA